MKKIFVVKKAKGWVIQQQEEREKSRSPVIFKTKAEAMEIAEEMASAMDLKIVVRNLTFQPGLERIIRKPES
jgi:hypothetical protein